MKTLFTIALCCTLQVNVSLAQTISNGFFKDANQINRPILFAMPEKQQGELSNDELKSLIKEYWTLNSNYEIVPFSEAIARAKKDKEKYVAAYFKTDKLYQIFDKRQNFDNLERNAFCVSYLCGGSRCYVSYVYFDDTITKADFVFGLMVTQYVYRNAGVFKEEIILKESIAINSNKLKTKKLLLDKNKTDLGNAELSKLYPYAFEFVDANTIDAAIIARDKNSLVIYDGKSVYGGSDNGQHVKIIYDPSDGALVTFSATKFGKKLSEKDISQFLANGASK